MLRLRTPSNGPVAAEKRVNSRREKEMDVHGEVVMHRFRTESCLLLSAALVAGCGDRNAPTAPTVGPLASKSAAGHLRPPGQLAFVSNRYANYSYQIYVMNADGSSPVRLTTSYPCASIQPAWSPDGSKIVFITGCSGVDIWVMNADGSGLANLTNSPAGYGNPTWSPDGARIASDGITIMNADGTGVRVLPYGIEPDWSPDGTMIAFSSGYPFNGVGDIYVMRADGTDITGLTNGHGRLESNRPRWRPVSGR